MIKRAKRLLFYAFAFGVTAAFGFLLAKNINQTHAADLGQFKAGNIISDSVMRDYNSMNINDIQTFLKSKNSCDDTRTYMADWYPSVSYHIENGHFVCMADESFNGKSAAQIIYEAAQRYHINPKVIIVLLQKEQGLVTDTWPHSVQYRAATGFGCPDTAACDSQYYGFENQVNRAAELFDDVMSGGWTNFPVGWNDIRYSPYEYDGGTYCGSSRVYIENRATSALYRYTPYQPNASALALGYGSGATCGAYGNRNFYLYFTDWFGSTQASRWTKMVDPRYMVVKDNTVKVYPDTSSYDDTWLTTGMLIKFDSKTDFYRDGELYTCLRTAEDTAKGIKRCALMPRLEEFYPEYTPVENTSIYISANYTCKVDLRRDKVMPFCYSNHELIQVAATYSMNGKDYYILKGDYDVNNYYAILASRAERVTVSSTTPKFLRATKETAKYLPGSSTKIQGIAKDQVVEFSSTITSTNGTVYYRSLCDTNNRRSQAIPAADLSEDIFTNFLFPRNLVANRDTDMIDPVTKSSCGHITKGTTLYFTTKTRANNTDYYRTEEKTNAGASCAVPASALSEVR